MTARAQSSEAKPLRTILHPALVHLPIALLPLSVLLDLGTLVFDGHELFLVRGAFVCILAGIATGLFAAVFGIVDFTGIRDDHPAKKTAVLHMILNVAALGLFAVSAGLRFGELGVERTPPLPFALSVIAFLVLGYSGYLGGTLVYSDGIAVGRHRRPTPLPEKTIIARGSDKSVPVADEGALRDGETLRVSVHGTIVVIARIAGGYYAFQEFCTHRFGPLSEGAIVGCNIMCPWHRSQFDVRNGHVVQGPAKVDLRTFRVESREGKIWIEAPPEKK
jgi:nitrite reductase/ring-hydroxylating ferredoxin subunit/uncharacterized membrane protein